MLKGYAQSIPSLARIAPIIVNTRLHTPKAINKGIPMSINIRIEAPIA